MIWWCFGSGFQRPWSANVLVEAPETLRAAKSRILMCGAGATAQTITPSERQRLTPRIFAMNEPAPSITVALRVPGQWSHPRELIERLPAGCRLTAETLILPDKTEVGFGVMDADDQFAQIFRSSCRQPPTADELATVDGYTVNVLLSGPGGSLNTARTMMQAGAAIVRAGGAGVFIDNSALAHGGQHWLEMTEDGGPDALSFAFVSIVRGQADVWTMGMHVLGLRDIVMKRADIEVGGFDIVEVIRYLSQSEKPIDNGHVIADLDGPRFQASTEDSPANLARSPMHNPFGRLRLLNMRDIAETN
jgi:hypothetical protein